MRSKTPTMKSSALQPPDFSGMPEFAKAIRGLAHVSKKEVDDAIASERAAKKKGKKR
ncbi:MAG TPA: hypothetical protein VK797_28760 [Tepidisphaeraceae bacterium]|jgi:hypothetical protein|nr:hypothetical protein [Tepidisphaeraceae bacterium]